MECYVKDYPRPQFVRGNWENLNGTWEFCFDDENMGEKNKWYQNFRGKEKIQVPFSYETKLSGIGDTTVHENVWYARTITIDKQLLEDNRYILHFEGSDFITKVWLNGQFVGSHKGGYTRFSFDLTDMAVDGENTLVVKVEDSLDMQQPRGKQRWLKHSFACFYVQTTGIWKTVWSEYVPQYSIQYVKMTPNLTDACIELEYEMNVPIGRSDFMVEAEVSFEGEFINRVSTAFVSARTTSKIDLERNDVNSYKVGVKLWSPLLPNLYDIKFTLKQDGKVWDEVCSYFAMRDISIHGPTITLNGWELQQRLILDQGYWEDSSMTPPSEEALIEDIDKVLELGYNGLRKHQKIEDERFYYWCDVKGMLVWCEAPATYQFSDCAVREFTTEWMEIVKQHYNHPSVITWTPFNESWGVGMIHKNRKQQLFTEAIYYLTKSFDTMRPVIVNDGWEHTISDILTLHDYQEDRNLSIQRYIETKDEILNNRRSFNHFRMAFVDGYEYKGQPIMLSEFGGIAFDNDGKGWGYGEQVQSEEDFIKRFESITNAFGQIPYMCGYCYTQVSDVQEEMNGLMDMKRNFKVNPQRIKEINIRQKRGQF